MFNTLIKKLNLKKFIESIKINLKIFLHIEFEIRIKTSLGPSVKMRVPKC